MKEVRMTALKHDGSEHRHWVQLFELPGEPGILWIEPNTAVVEADGKEWISPFPVVYWVHPEKWFNVAVLCREEGTAYYCNVASPVRFDAERDLYTFIDYDIDLVVSVDGDAEVVDEEEMTANAQAMHYPPDTIRQIAEATAELVAMYEAKEGPFDPDARERWMRKWEESKGT